MMIRINLLSTRDKEERKIEKRIGSIVRIGFALIFSLLLLAGLLASIEIILRIELKAAQNETNTDSPEARQEVEEAEKLLKDAYAAANKVNNSTSQIPNWSKVFQKLSAELPQGIIIKSIKIERFHVKMEGFAKSRDSFLIFQEKMRQGEFLNLSSPVSNLVAPENFNFIVEVDIDQKFLNQH